MYNSSVIFRRIDNASYSMQIQENVITKSQVKNEVNKYPVVTITKNAILVTVNVVFLLFF